MGDYQRVNMKGWAVEDRPREKLIARGLDSLTDAELVAILIGSGNHRETAVELARRILDRAGNNLHSLSLTTVDSLKSFEGIGDAKAIAIVAALELGRRRNHAIALVREKISSSVDVARYLQPLLGDLVHEEFWVLALNRQNQVVGKNKLSQGGLTSTIIDVRLLFKWSLEQHATAVIFAHNHPSGNLDPSEADRRITQQIKEAGAFLEIPLLDHVIITQSGYFSFADEGLL